MKGFKGLTGQSLRESPKGFRWREIVRVAGYLQSSHRKTKRALHQLVDLHEQLYEMQQAGDLDQEHLWALEKAMRFVSGGASRADRALRLLDDEAQVAREVERRLAQDEQAVAPGVEA